MKDDYLTQRIIGCAFKGHNSLGPGFLEKLPENALEIEREEPGIGRPRKEIFFTSRYVFA